MLKSIDYIIICDLENKYVVTSEEKFGYRPFFKGIIIVFYLF